jgi:phosphoenolpyruvate carboxykinase (GTP)
MRVLKWIVDRVNGRATDAPEGPFGYQPRYQDLHWKGLDFPQAKFTRITDIDRAEGLEEAEDQAVHFGSFGMRLPPELEAERQDLIRRLKTAPPVWTAG